MDLGVSVEARERRLDFHGLFEDPVECPSRPRTLEALEPPARVDASARNRPARGQDAVLRREPHERPLRGLPPTAGTGSDLPASRSSGGKAAACALASGSVKPTPPVTPQESCPPDLPCEPRLRRRRSRRAR